MKKYRQLLKELPSRKVVLAFGQFQPPTVGHEFMVNAVKKIASIQQADHIIFASTNQDKKNNLLSIDRKLYYLNRMFPKTNFASGDESSIEDVLGKLAKKYKTIVLVSPEDKTSQYQKIIKNLKIDNVIVVTTGERDPDSDSANGMNSFKMRESAKTGMFEVFKNGLPLSLTELDGKRLMNEIREDMGLDSIKEHVTLERDELREKYFAGEIFNVGDIVESENILYKIIKRGSNHLLVQDEAGNLVGKWPKDLTLKQEEKQ
jgi:phosphopantetheine adenylyltransferase